MGYNMKTLRNAIIALIALVSVPAIGHTQYHCRRIACLRDTRSSAFGCRKIH